MPQSDYRSSYRFELFSSVNNVLYSFVFFAASFTSWSSLILIFLIWWRNFVRHFQISTHDITSDSQSRVLFCRLCSFLTLVSKPVHSIDYMLFLRFLSVEINSRSPCMWFCNLVLMSTNRLINSENFCRFPLNTSFNLSSSRLIDSLYRALNKSVQHSRFCFLLVLASLYLPSIIFPWAIKQPRSDNYDRCLLYVSWPPLHRFINFPLVCVSITIEHHQAI